jgi:hypothetical protein
MKDMPFNTSFTIDGARRARVSLFPHEFEWIDGKGSQD